MESPTHNVYTEMETKYKHKCSEKGELNGLVNYNLLC
jgi:hypothetical protein